MKYGIITFQNTLNCGACLQAYALCKFLRNNGIECDILDYQCESIVDRELRFHKSSNVIKTIANYFLTWQKQKKMNYHFLDIMRQENMLSHVYNPETICSANDEYDGFITGSDQVWNTKITNRDYNFFLDFADAKKTKIAFSTSIGEMWKEEEKQKIISLLRKYNSISVREDIDVNVIEKLTGISTRHVCDPTMLLQDNEWRKIAIKPRETGYILLYNPESGVEKIAKEYSKKTGKKLIWIGTGKVKLGNKRGKTVIPAEWIGYIANADAVFTDSYHGLLFSLYFEKPVWTVYNRKRGSRQESLYKKLDIYDCKFSKDTGFEKTIDYKKCTSNIKSFRSESARVILSAIKDLRK